MQRAFLRAVMLAAAIAVAGCDNDVENQTPTEPPPTTIETFQGTVNVNGASTHTFDVGVAGTVTATLTEVTPDPAIAIGFALGTWNATSSVCQQVIPNDNALQGQILAGSASGRGTLCVRLFDNGKLTGAINYTVSVEHP